MIQHRVLVTGGSGFIAGHCIVQLLAHGHTVRATLRSLKQESAARNVLRDARAASLENLSFTAADLMADSGWAEAMSGIDYVLHVASPVHPGHVENEDEVIRPARDGALRVLQAARDAGVKRVVLTSAFHAVSWGHPRSDHVFTEADWTDLEGPGVDAYGKSKTIAERAAWDFISQTGGGLELTTMLPVAVMGPIMGRQVSGANHVVERLLTGELRVIPNLFFPIVDVRDVAAAHIAAMTNPAAAGERFLLSNGPAIAMKDIVATLKSELGVDAARVPTRTLPDFVLRLVALFRPDVAAVVPDLGRAKKTSNEKARRILGWIPGDPRAAIVAAGRSMVAKGLTDTR